MEFISLHFFSERSFNFLLRFYRTISIKYNLQSNISILSSIAYGFFNIVTSEIVTNLNNTGKRKRIYTKHKITTSEKDHIMLSEKGTPSQIRRNSNNYPPPLYLLNIQVKIQPFNHQKRHTQITLMILKHLKIPKIMTP